MTTVETGSDADWVESTPTNAPYWTALDEGRLVFQRCRACNRPWLPPRDHCPACLADDWAWVQAAGGGHVVSWVVYHVAYHPDFADRVPYNVAIVELDEGPRLITNLLSHNDRAIAVGAAVTLAVERDGARALARFRLVEDERAQGLEH